MIYTPIYDDMISERYCGHVPWIKSMEAFGSPGRDLVCHLERGHEGSHLAFNIWWSGGHVRAQW